MHHARNMLMGALVAMSLGLPALAQEAASPAPKPTVALPTITVRAMPQAVPVWEFERNGRTLRILGTLSPAHPEAMLPKDAIVREVARAQAVLLPPDLRIKADPSLFQMALMLPGMRKAQYNPDDRRLSDVLPAQDLVRWQALQAQFLPRERRVDRLRPAFAAERLFAAAVSTFGLTGSRTTESLVVDEAKPRKIAIVPTAFVVTLDEPRKALKAFNASSMDDLDCLRAVMARVERELPAMADRADAWAIGDLATLRSLPVQDHRLACSKAFVTSAAARFIDLSDVRSKVDDAWRTAVLRESGQHDRLLALVPVDRMVEGGALFEQLRRDGFRLVSSPPTQVPQDL
jgi:hypothetical protein